MNQIPTMKTGFTTMIDTPECPESLKSKIHEILLKLMGEAVIIGAKYAHVAGRNYVSSTDILYALQYQAHTFCTEDNLQTELENDETTLPVEFLDDEHETESDNEDDEDDESENDEDESNDDDLEYFTRAHSDDPLIIAMNTYHDEWEQWMPVNIIQQMLKDAIINNFTS